jgi:hypothetical protein
MGGRERVSHAYSCEDRGWCGPLLLDNIPESRLSTESYVSSPQNNHQHPDALWTPRYPVILGYPPVEGSDMYGNGSKVAHRKANHNNMGFCIT